MAVIMSVMAILVLGVRLGPCSVELRYGIVFVTVSRLLLAISDFRDSSENVA